MAIYNNVTVRTVVLLVGTKQLPGFVLPLNVDLYRCLFVCFVLPVTGGAGLLSEADLRRDRQD
jgi:hypothetical protein